MTPNGKPDLGRIVEIKRTLAGQEKRFECTVLRRAGSHLVVLFVSVVPMHVHGVELPAGTVTFGHFWADRPYNVYHWLDAAGGGTIAYYINLASDTRIGPARVEWQDLSVDILVNREGLAQVLDEDEVPVNAPAALRAQIAAAQRIALSDVAALIGELERERTALWPPSGLHAAGSLP